MNRYLLFELDSDSESSDDGQSSESSESNSSESLYDEYSDEEPDKTTIFYKLKKGLLRDVYCLYSSIILVLLKEMNSAIIMKEIRCMLVSMRFAELIV